MLIALILLYNYNNITTYTYSILAIQIKYILNPKAVMTMTMMMTDFLMIM